MQKQNGFTRFRPRLGHLAIVSALALAAVLAFGIADNASMADHESAESAEEPLQSTPATPSAGAEHFTPEEREALNAIIREYLLENPEVILEAVRRMEARQRAQERQRQREALLAEQQRILDGENAPVLGNPGGNVSLVEFFDYNCPYCKRMADDMRSLIQDDGELRVVMREFPILSDGSRFAARAALAARKQGKYEVLHFALLEAKGRVDEHSTLALAESVGIDVDKLMTDMDSPDVQAHIDESYRLAEVLGVRGTPAFVVGNEIIPGAVSLSQLREAIEQARNES